MRRHKTTTGQLSPLARRLTPADLATRRRKMIGRALDRIPAAQYRSWRPGDPDRLTAWQLAWAWLRRTWSRLTGRS